MDQGIEKMEKTEMTEKTILNQQRCKNCGGKSHQTELCPHKGKGARCFKCNVFEHIGKYCEDKAESSQANKNEPERLSDTESDRSMGTTLHVSSWKLKFLHGKIEVKAAICMGMLDLFIRQSCLTKFDCLPEERGPMIVQLHGQPVKTMGSHELYMTNGKEGHCIECHVVRDDELQEDMLLGMNFIRTMDIIIRKGIMTIKRTIIESDKDSSDVDDENNTTAQENSWWKEDERKHI